MPHRFKSTHFGITLAAFALLIAEFGAITHAYAHLPESAPVSVQGTTNGGHEPCGDCLSFSPLLSAAGAPAAPDFAAQRGPITALRGDARSLIGHRAHRHFRSRAPPPTP